MTLSKPKARASVHLSFEPCEQFVSGIARLAREFCRMTLADADAISRVHMAVHELTENLVKYGSAADVAVEVDLERYERVTVVRIRSRNRATPERLERAVQLLTRLREAPDAMAYYDQLIRDSAPVEGISGLGLARIRAEGELEVDFRVDGEELWVLLQTTVPDEVSP